LNLAPAWLAVATGRPRRGPGRAARCTSRFALARLAGVRVVGLVLAGFVLVGDALAVDLQRDEASGLEYLEVVTGGAATADPLPIVVAMHGLGDNPASFRLLLDDLPARARIVFPRGPMPHGPDGFSWFDFHSDDEEGAAELGAGIRAAADRVSTLILALKQKSGGPATAIVCGFSQGGMLSFALAAGNPDLIAVAIPVSGYLPSPLWPTERPKIRPLPKVLALHGETDKLIPVESARWSIEALRSNGYDGNLRSFPGVGHALSPAMRAMLTASVVTAVQELSLPGVVLPGPPSPASAVPPEAQPAAPADVKQAATSGVGPSAPVH